MKKKSYAWFWVVLTGLLVASAAYTGDIDVWLELAGPAGDPAGMVPWKRARRRPLV